MAGRWPGEPGGETSEGATRAVGRAILSSMRIDDLPAAPALLRVERDGRTLTALWRGGRLYDLSPLGLDRLLALPRQEIQERLETVARLPELDPAGVRLAAPAEGQEVWAAGVTYRRSRQARVEESTRSDVYERVYEAERPELFFKAAGWRVVPAGGEVGIRPDSGWDVPEPELAVLANARGEVIAYACGNDMSSRAIEGENPLYLPQAKIYDRSCAIGPAAVLAWQVRLAGACIRMTIRRGDQPVFQGEARLADMVRDPAELCRVLPAAYPLPVGAWLLTGTAIVPDPPYTAAAGDLVVISIDGLGTLTNRVVVVPHTGATAPPRLPGREG
jgi:2-dehydro-3-deoxy-D-arabinonate dehydratase